MAREPNLAVIRTPPRSPFLRLSGGSFGNLGDNLSALLAGASCLSQVPYTRMAREPNLTAQRAPPRSGVWCRVWGVGCRVQGVGCRVLNLAAQHATPRSTFFSSVLLSSLIQKSMSLTSVAPPCKIIRGFVWGLRKMHENWLNALLAGAFYSFYPYSVAPHSSNSQGVRLGI